ncbi:MAG: RNA 2',3'-cyclic phosphodiesterase [Lachnospiraceae bacterium]|nr:RNA 2',3'-cyclic phosphodiesterase [Lachnospiraceae bacterium]
MRLFIALQPDDSLKEALSAVTDGMRAQGIRANYVPEENLHITLAFIGEVSAGMVPAIEEAILNVPFEPLTLSLEGIGNFGNLLYAGLKESKPLMQYVSALRRSLDENNISYDRKKFKAHITLARRVEGKHSFSVRMPEQTLTIPGVSLMRSDRVRGGMRYTEIGYYA